MTDPSCCIVIPARYDSSRFPGKPLADIAGTPMIQRVWERCRSSRLAGAVLVATDDERIAGVVRAFGGDVVMTSPRCSTGSERVAEAAASRSEGIIVNVQGDEPLIDPATIDAVIARLRDDGEADIATAATPSHDAAGFADPNVVKAVCDPRGYALYFSRAPVPHRRDPGGATETVYLRHHGIYAFRRDALQRFVRLPASPLERNEQLEQLRALEAGMRIAVVTVPASGPAVDTPADIDRVVEALRSEALRSEALRCAERDRREGA